MPGLMREYPGLLPWHFGGDEHLTFREIIAITRDYHETVEERKRQAKEADAAARRAGRGR